MQRKEAIHKLLSDFHLNMIERSIFDGDQITIEEILDVINSQLNTRTIFPERASIWKKSGESVFEGYFIEKLNEENFVLHSQRALAHNCWQLGDKSEELFNDFEIVVKVYLKREYSNNIDGLPIANLERI